MALCMAYTPGIAITFKIRTRETNVAKDIDVNNI